MPDHGDGRLIPGQKTGQKRQKKDEQREEKRGGGLPLCLRPAENSRVKCHDKKRKEEVGKKRCIAARHPGGQGSTENRGNQEDTERPEHGAGNAVGGLQREGEADEAALQQPAEEEAETRPRVGQAAEAKHRQEEQEAENQADKDIADAALFAPSERPADDQPAGHPDKHAGRHIGKGVDAKPIAGESNQQEQEKTGEAAFVLSAAELFQAENAIGGAGTDDMAGGERVIRRGAQGLRHGHEVREADPGAVNPEKALYRLAGGAGKAGAQGHQLASPFVQAPVDPGKEDIGNRRLGQTRHDQEKAVKHAVQMNAERLEEE